MLEKMNLGFKTFLCGTITEERLNDFGVMVNALKHARKQFEQAWRHGAGDPDDEDAPGEYSYVKAGDAKVLVGALKAHLGGAKTKPTTRPLCSPRPSDPTRSRPTSASSFLGTKSKIKENEELAHSLHLLLGPPSAGLLEDARTAPLFQPAVVLEKSLFRRWGLNPPPL